MTVITAAASAMRATCVALDSAGVRAYSYPGTPGVLNIPANEYGWEFAVHFLAEWVSLRVRNGSSGWVAVLVEHYADFNADDADFNADKIAATVTNYVRNAYC